MKIRLLFLLLATAAVTIVLVQYRGQAGGDGYTVGDVLANPRPLIGREVTVSGIASDRLSFMGAGYFRLMDPKAKGGSVLTVLSSQGMPRNGQQVSVRGTLRQVYAAGAREGLVLVESAQQTSKDSSTAN
jgi:hypothetical protein